MANLVWANTHISGYVMHNSIGIVICSTKSLHTSLRVFVPQLASIFTYSNRIYSLIQIEKIYTNFLFLQLKVHNM